MAVPKAQDARPYMDPYLAGVGIGVVLLATYVIMGHGIGASGAFSSVVASGMAAVAPGHASANEAYAAFTPDGPRSFLSEWLVWEILGVMVGGFISARLAGRLDRDIVRGPRLSPAGRMTFALLGGMLMGLGAKFARGCTSGQALSGGAVLSIGSWIFIAGAFAAAYLAAPAVRKLWT